ncbi:hypothetical protein L2E82_11705 [Cichorium intybus]|uniref:Uncharacterized protein n=1 Tax=Cichorium intybus TaxID=13427 RepID=A0ACB9GE25_CICIN|nr:hypothetical protein L2E82_11705 [Cichorium intybus]
MDRQNPIILCSSSLRHYLIDFYREKEGEKRGNILKDKPGMALARPTEVDGYMEDKRFRRLTFDMMLAWEVPDGASQPSINIDYDAVFLTASIAGGQFQHFTYEKYPIGLERDIRKLRSHLESSLLSAQRSRSGERILEVDTQPALQHLGN